MTCSYGGANCATLLLILMLMAMQPTSALPNRTSSIEVPDDAGSVSVTVKVTLMIAGVVGSVVVIGLPALQPAGLILRQ